MSSAVFVEEARTKAADLVRMKSRGTGDTENAMRRVSSEYGIPFSALWSLRYRPPKDIMLSIYLGIVSAYEAECDRQIKRYEHEKSITEAKAGIAARLAGAAAALVREEG